MKLFTLSFFLFTFCSFYAGAQNCRPDASLPDDELGVFPMPYDANENPEGGIRDTACVGFDYEFVLTTVVGDIFRLDEAELDLDSLSLKKSGAVAGLPDGLDYACHPPNCSFKRQSKGCIVLYGKPKAGTEGNHKLKITGKIYVNGSPIGLTLNFPNSSIAPGDYTVMVGDAKKAPCLQLSALPELSKEMIEVFPNPVENRAVIHSEKPVSIDIYSQCGVLVQHLPNGEFFEVDTESWTAGIYYLKAFSNDEIVISKLLKP